MPTPSCETGSVPRLRSPASARSSLCRKNGGGELFWGVFDKNESALAFYRSLGAKEVPDVRLMRLPV